MLSCHRKCKVNLRNTLHFYRNTKLQKLVEQRRAWTWHHDSMTKYFVTLLQLLLHQLLVTICLDNKHHKPYTVCQTPTFMTWIICFDELRLSRFLSSSLSLQGWLCLQWTDLNMAENGDRQDTLAYSNTYTLWIYCWPMGMQASMGYVNVVMG